MRAIMISIKPQWVKKILSGEKTIEVRKNKPKIETPFKCYIYETKGQYVKSKNGACTKYGYGCGKVVAEFVCNKVQDNFKYLVTPKGLKNACLEEEEVENYLGNNGGYGWHISELKVYEKPKELGEFYQNIKCNSCKASGYESSACQYDENCIVPIPLKRPPQSWQFVEEI